MNSKTITSATPMHDIGSYTRCFFNEGTRQFYTTLKEAVEAAPNAAVLRCWRKGDTVSATHLVRCYGERICPIRMADYAIEVSLRHSTEDSQIIVAP